MLLCILHLSRYTKHTSKNTITLLSRISVTGVGRDSEFLVFCIISKRVPNRWTWPFRLVPQTSEATPQDSTSSLLLSYGPGCMLACSMSNVWDKPSETRTCVVNFVPQGGGTQVQRPKQTFVPRIAEISPVQLNKPIETFPTCIYSSSSSSSESARKATRVRRPASCLNVS